MSNADLTRADNDYNSLPMDLISPPDTYSIDNQDLSSEKYMLSRANEMKRAELIMWGNKINEMTRVNLIETGAYSSVVRMIDSTFFRKFENNIPNFINFLRASDTFKYQVQQIAIDYDVDMSNLARLIIQEAIELETYDKSYSEVYYEIGALFYSDDEN